MRLQHICFPVEFRKILRTPNLKSVSPSLFCKKGALTNFAKFTRIYAYARVLYLMKPQSLTLSKKEILAQMFSREFCEISHNPFLREPFGPLLLHKDSFCLLFHHDLSPFQKPCYTNFPAEHFLDLI